MIGMRQKSFLHKMQFEHFVIMDFPTGIMRPGTKTIWLLDLTSAMSYGPANLFFFEIFTLELWTCSLWLSGTPFAFIHLDPLFWDPYTLNFVKDRIFPEIKILKLSSCDGFSCLMKIANGTRNNLDTNKNIFWLNNQSLIERRTWPTWHRSDKKNILRMSPWTRSIQCLVHNQLAIHWINWIVNLTYVWCL